MNRLLKSQSANSFSRVLVTGGSGFIGHHLIKALIDSGAKINVVSRKDIHLPSGISLYKGDLSDPIFVNECIMKCNPTTIFHLAANKERSVLFSAFSRGIENNLTASLNIFEAANKLEGLNSIVVLGTAEEYGNNNCPFVEDMRELPVSAYSFSKMCVTKLCEVVCFLYRMPVVIMRASLAYGPGQSTDMFLPALIKSLIGNKAFPMTAGEQTRDFIYVSDLVDAIIKAAQSEKLIGRVTNVGSGFSVKLKDVALRVERMLGRSGMVQLGTLDYRQGEIMDYVVDNSKIKELLGWFPKVSLEEGLMRTINSFPESEMWKNH